MKWYAIFIVFIIIACNDPGEEPPDFQPAPDFQTYDDSITIALEVEVPDRKSLDFSTGGIKYLALGDSYTIGSGEKPDNRWPNLLRHRLLENGYPIEAPNILAQIGWTTSNLLSAIDKNDENPEYDMVSLLIGVNNQYRGADINIFKREFVQLLEYSLETAGSRAGLFVLSIPDYGVTPFGAYNPMQISQEIDEYNDFIRRVCYVNRIKFYNITEISRKAGDDLSYLASDLLHPSRKMYEEWVQMIMEDPPEMLIRD
jgi:lysophospholipase L1-like esterase